MNPIEKAKPASEAGPAAAGVTAAVENTNKNIGRRSGNKVDVTRTWSMTCWWRHKQVPGWRGLKTEEVQDRMKITRSTESRYYYLTDVAVVRIQPSRSSFVSRKFPRRAKLAWHRLSVSRRSNNWITEKEEWLWFIAVIETSLTIEYGIRWRDVLVTELCAHYDLLYTSCTFKNKTIMWV